MEKQHSGRSSFSGKLGFVLSAAGGILIIPSRTR